MTSVIEEAEILFLLALENGWTGEKRKTKFDFTWQVSSESAKLFNKRWLITKGNHINIIIVSIIMFSLVSPFSSSLLFMHHLNGEMPPKNGNRYRVIR